PASPARGERTASRRSASGWAGVLSSQRNISVLLRGARVPLGLQDPQRAYDLASRLMRLDHLVDEATLCGDVRIGELVPKLLHFLPAQGLRLLRALELPAVQDVDRPFRSHDRDLG